MTIDIKLLPCPNCGRRDGQIVCDGTLGYYSRCWNCGLELTEHKPTANDAIVSWNVLAAKYWAKDNLK